MRSSTRSWRSSSTAHLGLLVVVLTAVALVGCSSGSASPSAPSEPSTSCLEIAVEDAWVRPPQGMDRPAAGYLVICGGATDDALIGVTSDAAGMVEIHETTTDASGMSGMHPISRLEIPVHTIVELKPGSYHLMLMQVTGTMEVGATVQLELTFEKAGKVIVQAEVRQG
jgi:hypothetical protein